MGAFAEFERALIKERQMEGVALAKKRGAYKVRICIILIAELHDHNVFLLGL